MKRSYPFQVVNGQQVIPITGIQNAAHRFLIIFDPTPSAGTVSIEFQEVGSTQWTFVNKGRDVQLTLGEYAFDVEGAVAAIRLTFSSQVGGSNGLLWMTSSDIPNGVFSGGRAIITQTYEEANIKRGYQFELPLLMNPIASGTSYFLLAEIGSKDIIIKTRSIDTNGGVEYRPWRNAAYTKGVLVDRVVNLNGRSATVNTTKFYDVSNVSLVGATSYDIVKSASSTGSNRPLGHFPEGIERIVPAGSVILLEFRNVQSQDIWVVFKTSWAEVITDVDPIEPL